MINTIGIPKDSQKCKTCTQTDLYCYHYCNNIEFRGINA
jgi:hypothetical protein